MRTLLITILLVAASAGTQGQAAAQDVYELTSDSRIHIEGTSTVNDFTCRAGEVIGSGYVRGEELAAPKAGNDGAMDEGLELTAPVRSFDCGNERMNRDMYDALKASSHPEIEFVLKRVDVLEGGNTGEDGYMLRVNGFLTLAGEERNITFDIRGAVLPDGRLHAEGALDLRMSDFGITPPTALLGLVRAHDQITVRFDLYGAQEIGAGSSLPQADGNGSYIGEGGRR